MGTIPDVRVPVRIGDYRRLGDGLVGYWREAGDGYGDTFHAPLSEPIDNPSIRTHADGAEIRGHGCAGPGTGTAGIAIEHVGILRLAAAATPAAG